MKTWLALEMIVGVDAVDFGMVFTRRTFIGIPVVELATEGMADTAPVVGFFIKIVWEGFRATFCA